MTDCPMSLDPRDDEVMAALYLLAERQGVWHRIKATSIAEQCGWDPSDVGNHLAQWRDIELVDQTRHGWRLTKRGCTLMRRPQEAP